MKYFCIIYLLAFSTFSYTQDEASKWSLNGYVKSLSGLYDIALAPGTPRQTISDNFLHHRLNVNWYPSESLTFKGGVRTRFFYGEFSRLIPDYGNSLTAGGNDIINMTLINSGQNVLLHSIVDRAYFDYTQGNLEIRLGRQRINWGINTLWNPNDLFNAYSFTDFDYEERPGSDALRIRYFIGFAGSIELAVKGPFNGHKSTTALLYKWNTNDYDFQLLTGYTEDDVVLGGGWAGNISELGFKGEFSWFKSLIEDADDAFALALSGDYSFKNGLFLIGGLLYNSAGTVTSGSNLFSFDLSARNLYPYKWSTFIQANSPITPLISTGLAFIYSPVESSPVFLSPTLSYSLADNLDVSLVGQLVFQGNDVNYSNQANVFFLRFKWSY